MTKFVQALGLTLLAAFTLTGCELYFGEGDNDDEWTYCAADGYYVCEGDDCNWAGAECPAGGGGGFSCENDRDCAAGCFCQNGVCEEAGFCSADTDCPDGFHCDDRSSCVPDSCSDSASCPTGQICENGTCTSTCECSNDQEAIDNGFGYCDENTSTCQPGTDPSGSCAGTVTCNVVPTTCAAGTVPLIKDGCYTGACKAIAQCDTAPTCAALQHEADCLADNGRCAAVYTGINCQKPDGTACNAGDTNCTCQSFTYNSCAANGGSAKVVEVSLGNFMSMESLAH